MNSCKYNNLHFENKAFFGILFDVPLCCVRVSDKYSAFAKLRLDERVLPKTQGQRPTAV